MAEGAIDPQRAAEAFQARGVLQGRAFDELARRVLRDLGFKVNDAPFAVPELGVEFDAEIRSRSGSVYWCEFKGSWHGERPGLLRTDTVKKALADALLSWASPGDFPPVVLLTSHMPAPDLSGARMIQVALDSGAVLGVFCLNDPKDMARLQRLAGA